jgi:hypothetical protein
MPKYLKAARGARLSVAVLHDDAKHQYAYGPTSDTLVRHDVARPKAEMGQRRPTEAAIAGQVWRELPVRPAPKRQRRSWTSRLSTIFLAKRPREEFVHQDMQITGDEPLAANAPGFLTGGGELGQLIRGLDWTASPLGLPIAGRKI